MAQIKGPIMEFTREAWENAPEGARLEWWNPNNIWAPVHLVGYSTTHMPVIEQSKTSSIFLTHPSNLRITLPKRKVTVQLWQSLKAKSLATKILGVDTWDAGYNSWTFLGEHTFEIEGEW